MPEVESDEALMRAYVAGDRRAFERLFGRYASRIHAFFMRSFASRALADDLLQTTFLKLHRARADYKPDSPLRPWLYTIASRVRLDELRRRYRLAEDAGEEEIERASEKQAVDGAGEIANRELAQAVQAALAQLPEAQRTIIHLHRYEGMGFAEIAEILGTTEGAIKLRAFRAYEKLRTLLRPVVSGGEEAA